MGLPRFGGNLGLARVSLTRFSGIDTALEPSRGGDMPKRCPPKCRHRVLELVKAGRKVSEVARELEVSSQAIYNWRRQVRDRRRAASRCQQHRQRPADGGASTDRRA